jgi:predicted phosphodiesterase
MESLGFRLLGQFDLSSFLPAGRELKPTICISDTHLLPKSTSYGTDSPREILELLKAIPEFQVFVLGDFTESLTLNALELPDLLTSGRLAPLFNELKHRNGSKIITGNHDVHALPYLKEFFQSKLFVDGFRVGRVIFIHGHEAGMDATETIERMPRTVLLGGALNRLGVSIPFGTATNAALASHYNAIGLYPIFGHTHLPFVADFYANTGCFLRTYKSFITIQKNTLILWEKK